LDSSAAVAQPKAGREGVDRHAAFVSGGVEHQGFLRGRLEEGTNLAAGAAHGVVLEGAGEREQEQQH
jgi:hypothetical protein